MMKKRLLALLMAAVMTISLLPTTAWAHDAGACRGHPGTPRASKTSRAAKATGT